MGKILKGKCYPNRKCMLMADFAITVYHCAIDSLTAWTWNLQISVDTWFDAGIHAKKSKSSAEQI